jgi:hypothetical protein
MSVHLLGQHGVVFFGSRENPNRQRWWAERGLVRMEDSVDNSFHTYSVYEFLQRLSAVSDMILASREETKDKMHMFGDELDRYQRFCEGGAEIARKAKEQGMPSDASARRDAIRRLPTSVVVPNICEQF